MLRRDGDEPASLREKEIAGQIESIFMKSCDETRPAIGAWLDGELSLSEAEAVREHVAGCAVCAEERRQLEKLQAVMTSVFATEADQIAFEPFWRDVRDRIENRKSWPVELVDWVRSAVGAPLLVWAVPAVIVILIAVVSFDPFLSGSRWGLPRNNYAAVESIDAHGRNVALLREDETKTTVIWLYQNPEGENETTEAPAQNGPSF
jgi:putative zinc finger protein